MNILIIGAGNMGLTYAKSFLKARILSNDQLTLLVKSRDKIDQHHADHGLNLSTNPADCIPKADLIVLAVKPQDAHALFSQIKSSCDKDQVYLSIMAGIKIQSICDELGVNKVIRAMPNLPAQTGTGVTVFTSSDAVTRIELVMVQNLLNTTGKTIYLEREEMIDAGTAISGSGPAYVFYFMNAMIEAARNMGFSASEAELLVGQTFGGAVDLYHKSGDSCEQWIQKVASKGGTTEAALKSFGENKLSQIIIDGADAALARARELGN